MSGPQWETQILQILEEKGAGVVVAIFVAILTTLVYCVLHFVTIYGQGSKFWRGKGICSKKSRVLITIAHPDDEAMFFGPTIRNLVRAGNTVYILCFSYGDSEGLGLLRKAELWDSARTLGIRWSNITIVKHDKLKDGMANKWPVLPISAHIKNFVHSYGINMVVTFDERGVTGHLNHVGVHNAAMDLIERDLLPEGCEVYTLKSVGFFRQYCLTLFNIPPSYYFNNFVYVSQGRDYRRIVNAMQTHKSQMVWFRYLHVYFSAYMMVNILQKIPKPPPTSFYSSSSVQRRRKYR